jgi:uncharacterized protein YkwD
VRIAFFERRRRLFGRLPWLAFLTSRLLGAMGGFRDGGKAADGSGLRGCGRRFAWSVPRRESVAGRASTAGVAVKRRGGAADLIEAVHRRRRPVVSLLLPAVGVATFGCSSGFWDRPYAVAGRVQTAPAPPPVPWRPPAAPSPVEPPDVPAPAPPPYVAGPAGEDRATFDAVNRVRAARGLAPFRWDDRLYACARDHSAEQRLHRYMGHGSPDAARDDLGDRVRIAGYRGRAWAEVVAMGYPDVASVVDGWMRSRDHREVLLDPDLADAGFSRDGAHWTGNFGTPLAAEPAPVRRPSAPPRPPPPRTAERPLPAPAST